MHQKILIIIITQSAILFSGNCLGSQPRPLVEYGQSDDEIVPTVSATANVVQENPRPVITTVVMSRRREPASPREELGTYQERVTELTEVLDTTDRALRQERQVTSAPLSSNYLNRLEELYPESSPFFPPGYAPILMKETEDDTSEQQNLYAELCEVVEEYGTKRTTPKDIQRAFCQHGTLQSSIKASLNPGVALSRYIKQLSHAATLRFQLPVLLQNEREMDAQFKNLSPATPSMELAMAITEWNKLKTYRSELFNANLESSTYVDQSGKIHYVKENVVKSPPQSTEAIAVSSDSGSSEYGLFD